MCVQRDDSAAGANDEITVDVIAVDDHERENVCDSKPEEIPGWHDKLIGSRTLRPQDTSAPQNWCRSLRPVELCLIGIVLGRSVPAFPRSRHSCRSVSYHVFGVEVS